MGQTSNMMLEMDNYMKSLVETTEELSHTRAQVDIEAKIARKDTLTGIRNRNAYEEELRRLERQLEEGNTKFGFAVIDVNFLKSINDSYGHECGNLAIKECCGLICRVFSHSPVFRIGGDEFVVILENEDYEQAEKLAADFSRLQKREKKEAWKRVSAAIGYALYDETKDKSVEDTFSRADKAMCARKREMKAL